MLDKSVDYTGLNPEAVTLMRLIPPVKSLKALRLGANLKTFIGSLDILSDVIKIYANGKKIKCKVYSPKTPSRECMLYFHGGGFMYGGLNTADGGLRDYCARAGVNVISVDYSLAPEYKYPNAVNECYDVAENVFKNRADFGFDRIFLGGDSAGGNLAIVTATRLAAAGYRADKLILLYPFVEILYEGIEKKYPSVDLYGKGFFLTKDELMRMTPRYVPRHIDPANPLVSPINGDLSVLPPTLVFTAGFDPLRDMGRALADKAEAAGVPVRRVEYPDIIHGFFSMFHEYADRANEEIIAFCKDSAKTE